MRIYKYSARKWGRSVDDVVMIAAGYSGRAWRRIMQQIEPQIEETEIQRQIAEDPDAWPTSPDAKVLKRGRPLGRTKEQVLPN